LARSPLPTHVQQSRGQAPAPARQAAPAPEPVAAGPSRWRPWTTLALSVGAWGISLYLTIAHFSPGAVTLSCPNTGGINCAKVTTSPESMVFGIFPVALLGLIFWTAMIGLNLPQLWRSRWPLVAPARVAAVVTGMGFVLYLISVEAFQVHAICLWCTGVHILTFVVFMLILTGWEDETAASRR
jgi:uncharacterized membrane protein